MHLMKKVDKRIELLTLIPDSIMYRVIDVFSKIEKTETIFGGSL